MNRKERRALDKKVQAMLEKASATDRKGFGDFIDNAKQPPVLEEGAAVKLRVDQIMQRKDYSSKSDNYHVFVESHRGTIFTLHRPDAYKNRSLAELNEDPTDPKWLWWDGDLMRVEES